MTSYDITFIGHMCVDEITPFEGEAQRHAGSAVLCGSMAAISTGKKIAVITKMSEGDDVLLEPMRAKDIPVFVIPSESTTLSKVIYSSADVEDRVNYQLNIPPHYKIDELPDLYTYHIHLAGISDQEFTLHFIKSLKERGHRISIDMQSFVRQVDLETGRVHFRDVAQKKEIISLVDKVKLDVLEAKLLTGTENIQKAAGIVESWGCPEILITESEGVVARANGRTYHEPFSNKNNSGRTGRGDTTFGAYLARRVDHDVPDSLKFAAALVSIKMETPGPFDGGLEDVLKRMREAHER